MNGGRCANMGRHEDLEEITDPGAGDIGRRKRIRAEWPSSAGARSAEERQTGTEPAGKNFSGKRSAAKSAAGAGFAAKSAAEKWPGKSRAEANPAGEIRRRLPQT